MKTLPSKTPAARNARRTVRKYLAASMEYAVTGAEPRNFKNLDAKLPAALKTLAQIKRSAK